MKKTVKLADVLWEAANERLSITGWYEHGKSQWSCNAVAKASLCDDDAVCKELSPQVKHFLRSCGCRTGVENYTFGTQEDGKRQGVRYMWLLLAMHVAEDEGIEIEAPQ